MRNKPVIIAIATIFALFLIFTFYNNWLQNPSVITSSRIHLDTAKIITTTSDVSAWSTFNGPGFSLKYPNNWYYVKNVMNPDSQFAFSTDKKANTSMAGATIDTFLPASGRILDVVKDGIRADDNGNELFLGNPINSIYLLSINGKKVIEIQYSGYNAIYSRRLYVSMSGNKFMVLNFQANPAIKDSDLSKDLDILHSIAASAGDR